jgi:hypothetical protein
MHQNEENLTDNHPTPMVSEICTTKSTNEDYSSLVINSIL